MKLATKQAEQARAQARAVAAEGGGADITTGKVLRSATI